MKYLPIFMAVAAFFFAPSFAIAADPAVDGLINKLVEKGVISKDDAKQLEQDVKKGADETVQSTKAEAAAPDKKSKLKIPFEIKLRTQVRFDQGDLLVGSDNRYRAETDLFLRRVRLEIEKMFEKPPIGDDLKFEIVFEADRWDQDFRNGKHRDPANKVRLHYAYADWAFADWFATEIGKHKQPFIRVELTSSSRILFIERPAIAGEANETFGDYHQPQIMLHGGLLDGAFRYYLSYSDGVSSLDGLTDLDSSASAVQKEPWGKAYIGRIEIAPLGAGFAEKKKDDTGIGEENHLTLGMDAGMQNHIRYATSSIAEASADTRLASADLAGRYKFGDAGAITGQTEYITFRRQFNYKEDEKPKGYYAQLGYLLPGSILRGRLETAVRYELFDHDVVENAGKNGTKEKTFTFGLNHYLSKHSIKWSYNYVHTKFDEGVSEAKNDTVRILHQLLLQLYL